MDADDCQSVLAAVTTKLRDVERLMNDAGDFITANGILEECRCNVLRIQPLLDQNVFDVMSNSIAALGTICRSSEDTSHDMSYAARRIRTGWHYYNNNYRLSSVN